MDTYYEEKAKDSQQQLMYLMAIVTIIICIGFCYCTVRWTTHKCPEPFTPSKILKFKPVWKYSGSSEIRVAQAELCRHGIDVKVDGDCGKGTALAMCELLVMIENGYKVHTMFERKPNGEKERIKTNLSREKESGKTNRRNPKGRTDAFD